MSEEISGGSEGVDTGSEESIETSGEESEGKPKLPAIKKPTPKMRKVKVNGREEYVDEDAVFRDYQKYRAGDERMRQAAQKESEAEKLRRQLEEDPDAVFKDPKLKGRRRELAVKWLEEELEAELAEADPRDQKVAELEAKLKAIEDEKNEQDNKAKEEEKQKFIETRKTAISTTLAEAMKATPLSGHPESAAATLREMALYMRKAKEAGEEVTPDELVEHIHNNRFHQMYTLAHQYKGEELIEFFGEEIVNRIRRADLDRLRKSRDEPAQSYRSDSFSSPPRQGASKFIDPSDERFALRSSR